jgi:hypothetical protein
MLSQYHPISRTPAVRLPPIDDVVDGQRKAPFIPQIPLAAPVSPQTVWLLPIAISAHPSGQVCFEGIQGTIWLDWPDRGHSMDMVRPHIARAITTGGVHTLHGWRRRHFDVAGR